ncbi:MAG: Mov34/MPN/PAD-1 family protein [Candidatus Lokiarchaeota archaeon]|nr:Mov34/MPN/PAD-1 family protein [Candidatus Lokiarchaeota archaeon]
MKRENEIKLILPLSMVDDLKSCNRKALPIESCGLIFGEIKEVEIDIKRHQIHYVGKQFYCLKSNVESFGSFNLIQDSDKYFEIHQEAVIKNKLRMISIFHSHPVPAYPSSIDEGNMKFLDKDVGKVKNPFKNQIWTIMDMNTENINGFIYFNNELLQIDLQIQ